MRVNGHRLRRLAHAGARYGPRPFVERAPVVFGALFACLMPEHRRHVQHNLRRILGPRHAVTEHLQAARTFVEFAHCLTEGLASDRSDAREGRLEVTGRPHLDDGLSGGGAIFVTAHTGAWDVAARQLRQDFQTEVMLAMAAEPSAAARGFHDSLRARSGLRVVHVGQHALDALPIVRHLRSGGVLAVQLDRVGPLPALEVELFGERARVPAGPFAIARITQAPIVPVFCRRTGYFSYAIEASPVIRLDRTSTDRELGAAAQEAARAMERFIRRHPTQWFDFPSTPPR